MAESCSLCQHGQGIFPICVVAKGFKQSQPHFNAYIPRLESLLKLQLPPRESNTSQLLHLQTSSQLPPKSILLSIIGVSKISSENVEVWYISTYLGEEEGKP
jgi:hypothetical protein